MCERNSSSETKGWRAGEKRGGAGVSTELYMVAQTVKRLSTMRETWVRSLGREDPWRRKWQSTPVLLPGKSHGQRSLVGYTVHGVTKSWTRLSNFAFTFTWPANLGQGSSLLGWERSPGEEKGNPLQYSCLENSIDRGAWWATYSPWGCKELDPTEHTRIHTYICMDRNRICVCKIWLFTVFNLTILHF